MRIRTLIVAVSLLGSVSPTIHAEEFPHIQFENGAGQLIVHGKPFLILGGELGNSSAGTAAPADTILPKLARVHMNTVLMPVAWEEIEPVEGHFDFSVLDHWIDVARQQQIHIVILWFGSWKNAFSEYAPVWVKADTKRFPRAISAEGRPTEILSTFGEATLRYDSDAFSALMRHIREKDAEQQTVLMVQVENEIGYVGPGGRDRSAVANRLFNEAVPSELSRYIEKHRLRLSPELAAHFNAAGHTWVEMFGEAADEIFMAWHYALFVGKVAQAGKKEYPLPMYLNAQLPAPLERPGQYPSGGPHPYYQGVYRAAAPSVDFYAPDIYWPNFEYWVERYKQAGNPAFVPEARLDVAPYNALYTYGEARGFGFSPFGVDSLHMPENQPGLGDLYTVLDELADTVLTAQQTNQIRALVLHASSLRPMQTVALGGYLFDATLSRSWPTRNLLTNDGAMMVIQVAPDQFDVVGSGLSITISRDPDVDDKIAGIGSIDEMSYAHGNWVVSRHLNGDQSDQGRQLMLAAHEIHVYRVNVYSYQR